MFRKYKFYIGLSTALLSAVWRSQILDALQLTSITQDDLNEYIRNVTGKPGLRSLNLAELERIEKYVLSRCDEEPDSPIS